MPTKRLLLAICATLPLIAACGKPAPEPAADPEPQATPDASAAMPEARETQDLSAAAQRIADENIIIDTHIDVPMRILSQPQDVSVATPTGDFDYPRAVAGGLNAPFMSIYTGAELEAEGKSFEVAEQLIDAVEGMVANAPDKFAIARSPAEVREHFEQGIMSLPLGMENGSPIEGNLTNLKHFYDRGIRYITLAHGLSNHISDSSYDENRQWNGLSEFGVEVVKEMNRFGIMVDVSHLSDDAVLEVLEVSSAPVIASHSSARHFTPGWERNLSDELIVAIAENGGVVHINFGSSFVTAAAREYDAERFPASSAWLDEDPTRTYADLYRDFLPGYYAEHGPYPYATLDEVLDHFDHVVALVGVDHVGVGSDYDGVGDTLPIDLKDVSTYPNLIEGLLGRGYSEEDIVKILSGNLLRVWEEAEARAVKKQE